MKKNVSTHITSLVSAAVAVVTLVHPGFTVPTFVQSITVIVCSAVAGLLELTHSAAMHKWARDVTMAEQYMNTLIKVAPTPAAPAAPIDPTFPKS